MDKYIKLYTKVLDNPKTGLLKDKTWRIMIELFLVAGESFDDGKLPDIGLLSWRLRRSEKEIKDALKELEKIGTVTLSNDNPVVTNFEEYQNTNQTAYERVKNYRKRRRDNANDNANDNAVDNANDMQMITVDKDIDKDKDKNILTVTNVTDAAVQKTAKKSAYGSLKNVMLTDEEYQSLQEQFADADEKIEAMSLYFGSHGNAKKYKSHYATALNWARMAKERDQKPASGKKPEKKTYSFAEVGEMMRNGELTL